LARSRVLTCVRPHECSGSHAAGPYGIRGSGPNQNRVLLTLRRKLVFPIPSRRLLRHTFRLTSYASDSPTIVSKFTPRPSPVSPPLASAPNDAGHLVRQCNSHQHRWLRTIMLASHEPAGAPFRAAQRTTELAPMMSRRRSVRSPIFDVAPSLCFPPVECCNGVSPSQAAKSRPRLNVSAGGASAAMAVAITGPTPGMLMRRRATSSSLARRAMRCPGALCVDRATQHINQDAKDGARRFRERLLGILHSHNSLATCAGP